MLSFPVFGGRETRAIQLSACAFLACACSDDAASSPPLTRDASAAGTPDATFDGSEGRPDLVYANTIQPVTRAEQALPATFIPPFEDCRAPLEGEAPGGMNGRVCTNVAISGCTEPGRYFPDYASCEVVRTQRPYWPAAPAKLPPADDPRLADESFLRESAWAREQIVGSSRVDLQACKLEYSIVSPK